MKQLNPSREEVMAETKPLFASVWLALFSEIRKNYNHRHPIATPGIGNDKDKPGKSPDININ